MSLPRPRAARDQDIFTYSQWQLIWFKFRRHKLAVVSLVFAPLFM